MYCLEDLLFVMIWVLIRWKLNQSVSDRPQELSIMVDDDILNTIYKKDYTLIVDILIF